MRHLSGLVLLFKVFFVTAKAVSSVDKTQFTGNIRLDARNLFEWVDGYLACKDNLKTCVTTDLADESECHCWQQLFFSKGWNAAVSSVQQNKK